MTLISENTEAATRGRILVVAERLFREIGYQKTTVADIAKVLRMSPANIYRFFDSKKAIHEGVARHLMGEIEQASAAIATKAGPVTPRLRTLLLSIHAMSSERFVGDAKIHEMVRIAMEESWDVCMAHVDRITSIIAGLIAEGAASGEFDAPDIALAASCTHTAMMRFFHPQMMAECAEKPGPTLDQMIDFVIGALARREPALQASKEG